MVLLYISIVIFSVGFFQPYVRTAVKPESRSIEILVLPCCLHERQDTLVNRTHQTTAFDAHQDSPKFDTIAQSGDGTPSQSANTGLTF
jgi:hypothetical protein